MAPIFQYGEPFPIVHGTVAALASLRAKDNPDTPAPSEFLQPAKELSPGHRRSIGQECPKVNAPESRPSLAVRSRKGADGEIRSRNSATAVPIVEQKVREVLKIADRVCVLRNGRVSFTGPAAALHDDTKLREVYL
ncbi:MAG: hypothetical protein HY699_06510 [Deltaproteobacteria bacterium]|nr:hypothetical protein [Deltaproteobacteria bacterium]